MRGEPGGPVSPVMAALDARRRAQGISQRHLAGMLGTRQSHISDMLTGRISPTLAVVERMAAALGAHVGVTVGAAEVPPPSPHFAVLLGQQRKIAALMRDQAQAMAEMAVVIERQAAGPGGAQPPTGV